jgi:hypothetical protein
MANRYEELDLQESEVDVKVTRLNVLRNEEARTLTNVGFEIGARGMKELRTTVVI